MAVTSKTQLHTDINGLPAPITRASLIAVLNNMVDSWEDYFIQVTSTVRDGMSVADGVVVYNTDTLRLEMNLSGEWLPLSQVEQILIDCSGNPNYPEGGVGDIYYVTVAGKIGGGSGKDVYVGDIILCVALNAGGNEGAVGGSWKVVHCQSDDTQEFYAEIDLTSPDILALNGTPIQVVADPGAGKVIIPVATVLDYQYGTVDYASNTTLAIKHDTVSGNGTAIGSISGSADKLTVGSAASGVSLSNKALMVIAQTGNPTAGDGTATVGVYYKIHTL